MVILEDLFPGLRGKSYRITSPADDRYNCIAWAIGVDNQWWWPFGDAMNAYWPTGLPSEETLSAFQVMFADLGFEMADHEDWEPGFVKVALFTDSAGIPTHAARQLAEGLWTSKLGKLEDIEHSLHDLEGVEYGKVTQLFKRPLVVGP